MTPILPNTDGFSQASADLDNFSQDLTSLDKLAPEHQGYIEAESDQTTHTAQRQINREEVRQQLAALGYKAGDIVYLRAFYPDSDPRKTKDAGRKAEATKLDQLIKNATTFQSEGRGVYFVVNGSGHKDVDVTKTRAIFYEHDNLDKSAQIELWKDLGLPEPTLQVDTGGKSIHSYWVFDEFVAVENWRSLQTDLLEFADADRSLKNPSRVMRLAGAWHSSGNQSRIVTNSGERYTYNELRAIVPIPTKPEPTLFQQKPQGQAFYTSEKPDSYEALRVPVPMPAPLLCALGKENKSLLQGVATQRNTSMATLARDLIGTANDFARLGQSTSDDAYTLFIDACRRCSPGGGWDEKEWEQIWKSAEQSSPSASISKASADAVENCIKGWYWQEFGSKDRSKRSNHTHKTPTSTKLSKREAVKQAREILRSGQDELTTNLDLDEIREAAGISESVWEHKIIKPMKRDMDAERFKLELLALIQMEDPVERCRQIALLAPKYSMGAGAIKEAMSAMKSRTQTAEVRSMSLDELFAETTEAMEWIVPGMLPVGETVLLTALPKTGKSKLAIDLAFCIATGEERFLGEEVKQGRVLLVCPDASKQSLKNELNRRGFRSQDSPNVRTLSRWSIDQISVLEKELEDFRPDFVVIDSLKAITSGKEINENSAEFADNIITLNSLLTRYRAASLLVHHANKGSEASGVERARGSTAIVGACWGMWLIEPIPQPDPDNSKRMIVDPRDPNRKFHVTSRDSEGTILNIQFNAENNSWTSKGEFELEEGEAKKRQTINERLMNIFRSNPEKEWSGPQIMELLGGIEYDQRTPYYNALNRMENKRLISVRTAPGQKRYNLYSLPKFDQTGTLDIVSAKTKIPVPPPPPIPTVQNDDYSSETHIQQRLENSHQNSHQIVITSDGCASLKNAENLTEQKLDPIVITSQLSQGGEGVKCVDVAETVTTAKPELAQTPPIAPPEPETPLTPPEPPKSNAAELVNHIVATVRKAIAENDAIAIKKEFTKTQKRDSTGRLLLAAKACLTDTEKEACKVLLASRKQSQPQSPTVEAASEPIAFPENSQQPELAEPARTPTQPQPVESPAQPTDTSSEAQPELAELATEATELQPVEAEPEVVEDAE